MKLFDEIINEIENKYKNTSNNIGWRFLLTSKRTLDVNNGIFFITLNPGGNFENANHSKGSCENGCAYFEEHWKGSDKKGDAPLQKQFQYLFMELASKMKSTDFKELIENSVCGYFIPFRSPTFEKLENQKESIAFGEQLWGKILSKQKIKLIICIDKITYKHIKNILKDILFYNEIRKEEFEINWGNYKSDVVKYKKDNEIITLIRFPHLSRFPIFKRGKSETNIDQIFDSALKQS